MTIKQNKKGYYIQDTQGQIHAKHIPNMGIAKQLLTGINEAINGLRGI